MNTKVCLCFLLYFGFMVGGKNYAQSLGTSYGYVYLFETQAIGPSVSQVVPVKTDWWKFVPTDIRAVRLLIPGFILRTGQKMALFPVNLLRVNGVNFIETSRKLSRLVEEAYIFTHYDHSLDLPVLTTFHHYLYKSRRLKQTLKLTAYEILQLNQLNRLTRMKSGIPLQISGIIFEPKKQDEILKDLGSEDWLINHRKLLSADKDNLETSTMDKVYDYFEGGLLADLYGSVKETCRTGRDFCESVSNAYNYENHIENSKPLEKYHEMAREALMAEFQQSIEMICSDESAKECPEG